ncbi:MAG TPA: hypothetical protein VHZ75_01360 [Solirubrobacteraceae bacterium]|jgi:hypothetical protein|nr:hypothetical protein [Solirubrobacteraceae bacterium]
MLFDLRGRGRRRTVQVIYVGLALLMGGGLLLFGIGSSSSGGLFDAFSSNTSSAPATKTLDKRVKAALTKTQTHPKDADAFAQLAILRFQRANLDGIAADGTYTSDGKQRLALAAAAWQQHLALNPKQPNVRAANLMVQAYGTGALDQLAKAVSAKLIVAAATKPPTTNVYQQLAALAYQAKQNRVGDLAANRAVELASPSQRKQLRSALTLFKKQAAANAALAASTTTTG